MTFLTSLADSQNSIIPKHVLGGQTADQVNKSTFKTQSPVGTGPFTVGQVVPGQFAEFVANETYFQGRPKLDKIIYKLITPETATAQIQSGELDIFLAAGAANFDLLSTVSTLDVRSVTSPGIFTFQFNSETPGAARRVEAPTWAWTCRRSPSISPTSVCARRCTTRSTGARSTRSCSAAATGCSSTRPGSTRTSPA